MDDGFGVGMVGLLTQMTGQTGGVKKMEECMVSLRRIDKSALHGHGDVPGEEDEAS